MNNRVRSALDAFGKAVLARLRERVMTQPPRQTSIVKLKFPDLGMPEILTEQHVLWHETLSDMFHPLQATVPEVEELGRAIFEEGLHHRKLPLSGPEGPIDNPVYEDARSFFAPSELYGIIYNYILHNNTIEYNEEKLRDELEQYIRGWALPELPLVAVVPLLRFQTANIIQVANNLSLKPFTGEAKTLVWAKSEWERMRYTLADFASARFALEWSLTQDRRERTSPLPELERTANLLITALRLLHSGHISAPAGVIYTSPVIPNPSMEAWWGNFRVPECEPNTGGQEYELTENDVPQFKELFQELQASAKDNRFRQIAVAIRRFNLSYARSNHDDELIDLVVALESSLLFNLPEKQELRYRMALRGAALLREARNPKDCFRFIRDLYDIRSAIVHSGRTLENMGTAREKPLRPFLDSGTGIYSFVEEAREITRQVIKAYLKQHKSGASVGSVNEGLDDSILLGLEPDEI